MSVPKGVHVSGAPSGPRYSVLQRAWQRSSYALCSSELSLQFPGPQPLPASLEASSDTCLKESGAAYASVPAEPEAATQHVPQMETLADLRFSETQGSAFILPTYSILKPKVPSLRQILSLRVALQLLVQLELPLGGWS